MPQSVVGSGSISLKPGARPAVADLAERLNGWVEWDQFELSEDRLIYAYDDVVTIGTAGDLDEFFEEVASEHATQAWAHYSEDGEVWVYGADERSRLQAEIAELEVRAAEAQKALADAQLRYAGLGQA